eukprot:CAMPEP_0194039796 /NCGR_PEP_ID=MMETSP0009_2-20130614/11893_1 /TAXON_ID=210454 /ORGANISM="Grammatophora oceanica, Strain CCMP 410" /LENGTH=538 /DNA_ID=CAMNT_0038682743 /DNA_START=101 /DNA_END=1717 /DNA_ORIENTATION=-
MQRRQRSSASRGTNGTTSPPSSLNGGLSSRSSAQSKKKSSLSLVSVLGGLVSMLAIGLCLIVVMPTTKISTSSSTDASASSAAGQGDVTAGFKEAHEMIRKRETVQQSSPSPKLQADTTGRSGVHWPVPEGIRQMEPIQGEPEYHVIFSTGCSTFQDWQSYVFFYHAWKSGQQGNVTRVASGCSDKDAETLRTLFKEQIEIMAPGRFHLHLTPDYSRIKPKVNFKYFNKPFGTRHWMENALGFPDKPLNEDTIIILLDPDQVILRPFTNDFSGPAEVWKPTHSKIPHRIKVEHGAPFGQQYGFAMQWKNKVNATYVAQGPTRLTTMDDAEAQGHYLVGPPYVATARDMYQIVTTWCDFVPRVHDDYPHLLAEMFGYCLAAAHLNLPHQVAWGFMVSDIGVGGEGWKMVREMQPDETVCENTPQDKMPHVLHYCQRYMLGKFFIGKYRLRKDFISCESPLLVEPTADIVKLRHQVAPDGTRIDLTKDDSAKLNAFMLCQLIPRLNEAAVFFKQHHCTNPNMEYSYIFHETLEDEAIRFL